MDNGYLTLDHLSRGDVIEYRLHMPVDVVRAHPKVIQDAGMVAVQRGPVVYCLEEADNGSDLHNLSIDPNGEFKEMFSESKLSGIVEVSCPAKRISEAGWDEYELYAANHKPLHEKTTARFIPYYAWNNRGEGEMRVWIRAQ